MTQPSPQDDLPPGPWLYRPNKHDDWGVVRAGKDGPIIAVARSSKFDVDEDKHRHERTDPYEAIARAIAAIPEMRAENERLRAVQTTCDVFKEENRRLRATELQAEIERWDETDPLVNKRLKEDLNEILTLRKEKAELIEMLATRTTHPEYVEVLKRYRHANKTEA
jgi:hypothetical protein